MNDVVWNDCLLCSSSWGSCTNAALCKDKDVKKGVDGVCVSCIANAEAGCSLFSITSKDACSTANVSQAVTCHHGYVAMPRYCEDHPGFCYVSCQRNLNPKQSL